MTLSGKQELETITDEKGEYAFRRVKDDVIEMNAFGADGKNLFTVAIATKEKLPEDIFTIIEQQKSALEFDRSGTTLFVDAVLSAAISAVNSDVDAAMHLTETGYETKKEDHE